MSRKKPKNNPTLISALEAVANLWWDAFAKLDSMSGSEALMAHSEIERMQVVQKSAAFYRSFYPLRVQMVTLLADTYRRYFKLSLAHLSQTGGDPTNWAWLQLQPAVHAALEWMRDWYILACEGENRKIRRIASFPFVPGGTVSTPVPAFLAPLPPSADWQAPSWLFGVSLVFFGVGLMKTEHVPSMESSERLGQSHTRLLFKGAQKVFLWALGTAIETVRNEELAAAGAIPTEMAGDQGGETHNPEHWLKGTKGLVRKSDLSRYMHTLTEKQQLAISLKYEYGLKLGEIASRMGLDRKTAYEHIKAGETKMGRFHSGEKRKAQDSKSTPE